MNSKYYEVVPFNAVFREMVHTINQWDGAFAKFEADFLSDKDVRQLTILQLKKMFGDNESKESLPSTEANTSGAATDSENQSTPITSQTSVDEAEDEKMDEKTEIKLDDKTDGMSVEMSEMKRTETASTEAGPEADSEDLPTPKATVTETEPPLPVEPVNVARIDQIVEEAEVVERVEPLDLAIPSPSPVLTKTSSTTTQQSSEESSDPPSTVHSMPPAAPGSERPEEPVIPVLAPEMSLSEKVAQLRREALAASLLDANEGSAAQSSQNKPRQVGERNVSSSRRAGAAISPPIVRAITQPTNTLSRNTSSLSKLVKEQKQQKEGGFGELHRVSTDSSNTTTEKKFVADRIALGGLKNRGKLPVSGIPRYVHPKKKESRVSTLARHFEQLSREFEKERIKDRKKQAARMNRPRAFLPRSSTKAIIEVYNDVDQAFQEQEEKPATVVEEVEAPAVVEEKPEPAEIAGAPADAVTEGPSAAELSAELAPGSPTVPTSQADDTATDGETDDQLREGQEVGSDDEAGASDADQSILDDILPDVKAIADSLEPSEEVPLELPKHQRTSLMTMLTKFWAERSASGWSQLEYPFTAVDHLFNDSDIIVREDEPSSLIALALASDDYKSKLAENRRHWKKRSVRKEEGGQSSSDDGLEMYDHSHTHGGGTSATSDDEELEKSLTAPTSQHLKYAYTEGTARMTCKIFYAEQFDALRQKCGVADRLVESLSRCLKWDSKGGKTKSVFLKTLDDRLVMKSLSPVETSAFLRFAPDYFNIMAKTLFHDLPSVIAKMLGFFQVIIKNPLTNTEIKLDLLVMENLFYDRSPTRIFDLKGSMRNRKIQSTGEQFEVLLDENMVEYIYESPLFAREHSKGLLRASVWNDTLFLAMQNVMDYSLMVAVDEAKKELVVGIIDCIRTYTWDKRVESWIKDRGFVGGGRNRPTVTSPKEYKTRFREAMARYILQSPSCWHQFRIRDVSTRETPRTRFEEEA